MIDLSIIIVNYNVKEFLLNLLESIQYASKNISKEIIVVDNNSDDYSISAIKEKYPSIITIENKTNVGFGSANNQALEIAEGKYLLLINPDTLVKENTFDVMVKFLEDNKFVGIAGCKVLNPDGTLQLACRRSFPRPWVSFTKVTGLSSMFPKSKVFAKYNLTYLDENESNEVDAISGSFMMLTREVYKKLGGFEGSPSEYTRSEGINENDPLHAYGAEWGKENQLSDKALNELVEGYNTKQSEQIEAYQAEQIARSKQISNKASQK